MDSRLGRRGDGERGVIVVLALLILLSLAGIAIVATHRVSLEIDRSGNYRVQKNALLATQVGFMAGLSLLERQGNTLMEQMRASADLATAPTPDATGRVEDTRAIKLTMASFADDGDARTELVDLDGDEMDGGGGSFGRPLRPGEMDFLTRIAVIGEADGTVAGFSAGEYAFSRVVMTTTGWFGLGNTLESNQGGGLSMARATAQKRVFLLVGPQTVPQVAR
jgi:hypothetical protein